MQRPQITRGTTRNQEHQVALLQARPLEPLDAPPPSPLLSRTHRFPPEDGPVLLHVVVVGVGEDDGQKKRLLLRVAAQVVLVHCNGSGIGSDVIKQLRLHVTTMFRQKHRHKRTDIACAHTHAHTRTHTQARVLSEEDTLTFSQEVLEVPARL